MLHILLVSAAFGCESHAFSLPTSPPTPASKISIDPPLPSCVGRVSSTISVSVPPSKNEEDDEGNEKEVTRTKVVNYYVIGTSHFRCQSSQDVTELLRPNHNNTDRQNNTNFRADGCVIELDPERTVRLTLDDAMVAASLTAPRTTTAAAQKHRFQQRWFGGDFLAAIATSQDLDIPLFLGDESPLQTRQRLFNLWDPKSYDGTKLRAAVSMALFENTHRRGGREETEATTSPTTLYVDVLGTFLDDPQKLIPLLATIALPLLTVMLGLILHPPPPALSLSTTATVTPMTLTMLLPILGSLLLSYLLTCKVYNNLIADRDLLLASTAQRAAQIVALLQSNHLIRKRWTFSSSASTHTSTSKNTNTSTRNTDGSINEDSATSETDIPLFTLKTPLQKNATRTLNLFEPRWLNMMDTLQQQHQTQYDQNSGKEDAQSNMRIGCVNCVNKFYSAVNLAATDKEATKSSSSSVVFAEGRYADVIFQPRGRYATVHQVTESSRPSGARKLVTQIIGHESFAVPTNPSHITIMPDDGYLSVAPANLLRQQQSGASSSSSSTGTTRTDNSPNANANCEYNNDHDSDDDEDDNDDDNEEINIVVVVGLLHANGVLQCLANSNHNNNNNNDL